MRKVEDKGGKMVRLNLRHLVAAAAGLVAGVATATADPIQITSGSLVFQIGRAHV